MGRRGVVTQINISRGGVPKRPVPSARVSDAGVEGDRHDHPRHGGLEAAVSLFAAEAIARVASEGHPIGPGTTGENLTVAGLDWSLVAPGVHLRIGEVVLTGVAPAIANAIYHATGRRFRTLPIRLDDLHA